MGNVKCCYSTFSECCHECSKCAHCYDLSLSKLRDILYSIKSKIVDYSCCVVNKAHYGYSYCEDLSKSEFSLLIDYKDSLEKYYKELVKSWGHCLCPEEIQTIYERALELVDISCCKNPQRCDLLIDDSKLDLWTSLHPGCQAYEDWELSTIKILCQVGISVKIPDDPKVLIAKVESIPLKNMCILFNEMQLGYLDAPALFAALNKSKIVPKITKEECELNYNLVVEKTKCDLTFETYSKLLDCNLTPQIISRLLECNLTLDYNATKQTCDIIINPSTTISLCDLEFDVHSENTNCVLLAEITGSDSICEEIAEIIDL